MNKVKKIVVKRFPTHNTNYSKKKHDNIPYHNTNQNQLKLKQNNLSLIHTINLNWLKNTKN